MLSNISLLNVILVDFTFHLLECLTDLLTSCRLPIQQMTVQKAINLHQLFLMSSELSDVRKHFSIVNKHWKEVYLCNYCLNCYAKRSYNRNTLQYEPSLWSTFDKQAQLNCSISTPSSPANGFTVIPSPSTPRMSLSVSSTIRCPCYLVDTLTSKRLNVFIRTTFEGNVSLWFHGWSNKTKESKAWLKQYVHVDHPTG